MNNKILMTLMGMEIGGAETHVLELCKALKKRGMMVYVASNGGAYEPELEACGIVHYKVPLHNKRLGNIINAYSALKKIIIDNNIPLVHAHARIPGFLCGILQKKLRFRFVTTAHWVFSTEFPFNILTNWGEKSLAVSEDIKRYLMDNYRVPETNIQVTVNGIDTDKFSPETDCKALREKYVMDNAHIRITSLSRLDSDRSLPAHLLIAAAPELLRAYPNVEIYIVGDGNDFEPVRGEAEKMNAFLQELRTETDEIRRPVINLTGSSTDVNQWLAATDIFIGASRSVMEAMAAGKPIIACGNEGYLGLLDEDNLPVAVNTNFCYRGCENGTAEKLAADLLIMLGKTPAERQAMGAMSRDFIQEYYSVERMANDAIAVYQSVLGAPEPDSKRVDRQPRAGQRYKTDVMISGYYGYNNSGDDILLQSIIDDLRACQADLRITVLSMHPKETRKQYAAHAIHRFNFPLIWRYLRKTRLLITGGGTLIQDLTSTQSLIYYLWVIDTARRANVKNMLYASGIGPVSKPANIARVRKVLNNVDLITLREEASLETLKSFGITAPETRVTADAAFSLRPADEDAARTCLADLGVNKPFFCIAIRSWKRNPPGFERHIAQFADYAVEHFCCQAVFVPMRPSEDTDISKRVMALMRQPGIFMEPPPEGETDDINRIRGVVGLSEFVLGMRLHTLIYAISKGVPVIGLVYEPKVQRLMDSMGQNLYMDVETIDGQTLIQYAEVIQADHAAISKAVWDAGQAARQKAAVNAELCFALLEAPSCKRHSL